MKFSYISAASVFTSTEEKIIEIAGRYFNSLNKIGGTRINAGETNSLPLFYFVVTGGVENYVLADVEKRTSGPVYLIAHPGNNSLPASLEIAARLGQNNIYNRIFYLPSENDRDALNSIAEAAEDINVFNYLRTVRLGTIGKPSDWLIASVPPVETVRSVWGPEIIEVPIDEVLSAINQVNGNGAHAESILSGGHFAGAAGVSEGDIGRAVKVYTSLKEIIGRYKLDFITVRCFDIVLQAGTSGCYALARLTDEGITAGCEGDITSIVGMLWGSRLLGLTPWMANPSGIDVNENSLRLAHCTVPASLTRSYKFRTHFESGIGVGIQGEIPEGPVTLLRIGGSGMEKLWSAEGTILRNGNSENLCRTQVEIKLSGGSSVSDLLNQPLGNHLVLFEGHHKARLEKAHGILRCLRSAGL